jgi:hypothetical protein
MLGQLTRYPPSGSQTSIGGLSFFLIGNSQNAAKNAHFFHKSFMNIFMYKCAHTHTHTHSLSLSLSLVFLSIKIG